MAIPSFDKENDTANIAPTPGNPTETPSTTFTGATGQGNDPNARRAGYHFDQITNTWVADTAFSTSTVVNDPTPGATGFRPTPTNPVDSSGAFTGVRGHEHDPAFGTDPDPTSTSRLTDGIPATGPVVAEEAVDANASPAFAQALKDTDAAISGNDDAKIEAQRTAVANLAGHNVHPVFPQGYEAIGNASGATGSRIVHAAGVITNDERAELDAKLVAALSTTPKPEKATPKLEKAATTYSRPTPWPTPETTQTEPFAKPTPFTPTQPRDAGTFS